MPVNKVKRRGSYAPLSSHYYKDDKVIRAGEKAELLYVRGLAFCADVLNDGFISDAQLAHVGVGLSNLKARAKQLVDTGAWERAAGGYFVTAWLRWNKSREDILEEGRKDAARKGSQDPDQPLPPEPPPGDDRESDPWEDGGSNSSGQIPFGNHTESSRSSYGVRRDSEPSRAGLRPRPPEPEPEPTPEPEPPLATQGGSGGGANDDAQPDEAKPASRKRSADGHRLPSDWQPSEGDRKWLFEKAPDLYPHGGEATEEFRDYWLSKAGKDARKTEWSRTWRNWMRKQRGFPGNPPRYDGSAYRKATTTEIVASGRDLVSQYQAQEAEEERRASVTQLPMRGIS